MAEKKNNNNKKPLIVIASNRGPFTFHKRSDGAFEIQRGAGGLVTALGSLVEQQDILWVAAAMSEDDRSWNKAQEESIQEVEGILLRLVNPDTDAYEGYYNIISNPLLWFIHHQLWDAPRAPNITKETWAAWHNGYLNINKLFADAIIDAVKDSNRPIVIFPQDYQLYMVPHYLREQLGDQVQIQPFIHIPWPSPDAWHVLPREMRNAIFQSLLNADRIGFQTNKDAFNFVQTCRFYLDDAHTRGSRDSIHYAGRLVKAQAYPISIDVEKVQAIVQEDETRLLKAQLINTIGDNDLILRVDRVEPSKNILRGLIAYQTLLEKYPQYRGKVQLFALLVPSRMEVEQYKDYLREIMAEAGLINAAYSDSLWEPVRIIVGDNYSRAIAAMQLYSVLLVNPIADGMNLVAKEGVLVNQRDGVLVLSEHTGAFDELGECALSVSPFDIYGTAEAMHQALSMPHDERHDRAEKMRAHVNSAGVKRWFNDQMKDALNALSSASD
jgi:trehalose 6-phosphate synthase